MNVNAAVQTGAQRAARRVVTTLRLDDARSLETLADAYCVAYRCQAPLIVRIADDMLADLHADIGSGRTDRVVFLGRDGHSLAIAMARLEPAFYRSHCSNLVLSRALLENALQDLEHHQGRTFPTVSAFRRVASRVDPADTVGGLRVLTDYLHAHQVPAGRADSRITLVDTSFKGTAQELMAAIYPETTFTGRYAFHGASPHDPHPGSKKGYEVHLRADQTRGGLPLNVLPADRSMTFAHQVAIGTIEETLNGPMTSPARIRASGPEQTVQRNETEALLGLDHGRISPRLRDPRVREGVKVAMLLAVADCARDSAVLRDRGRDYRRPLEQGALQYRTDVRSWIDRSGPDARLTEFLDSFVRHTDKGHAAALQRALMRVLRPADSDAIWASYGRCRSDDDKRVFVENVLSALHSTGGGDGQQGHRRQRRDYELVGARRAEREP
jgi:hypothetical protein